MQLNEFFQNLTVNSTDLEFRVSLTRILKKLTIQFPSYKFFFILRGFQHGPFKPYIEAQPIPPAEKLAMDINNLMVLT